MSQSSRSSPSLSSRSLSSVKSSKSSSDSVDEERQALEGFVEEALHEHRTAIKKLKKKMFATFKTRDREVAEIEARSEAMYQKMIADHDEFCKSNSGIVADPILEVIANLEKLRSEGLPDLERCSEAIDPDNAEEVAKAIKKKYSISKKLRTQWRRRLVRKTHEELEVKKAEIMKEVERDIKNYSALVNGFMNAESSILKSNGSSLQDGQNPSKIVSRNDTL